MGKRILLAGLFHETHTFLDQELRLNDFEILVGDELLSVRGDSSPLAGALQVSEECEWDVTPIIDLRATPGGLVADEVLDQFWSEFERVAAPRLAARDVDGIYLVLHGAMVCRSCEDVEGEIIARIRHLPGADQVPIGGVLDLHGNLSQATIEQTQGLVAYQCNPHTDAKEAAISGARLLQRVLESPRWPRSIWAQPGIIWPPTGVATNDEPMRSLEAIARRIERDDPQIGCVNVMAGFSFADTRDTGVSFAVTTFGDESQARVYLQELVNHALHNRALGLQLPPTLSEVLPKVHAHLAADETPIILVEPADNIGGGAPGDTTDLLRTFIDEQLDGAAVVINDPESVQQARQLGIGAAGSFRIGGKSRDSFTQPVYVDAIVQSLSDGLFQLEDPHSHLASMCGNQIDMGPCAVLRANGTLILLTTHKTPPFDLGQWRSQGIEPTTCRVIAVKAAVAHRRAYDPITRVTYTVTTNGPCSSDLSVFPYQRARYR